MIKLVTPIMLVLLNACTFNYVDRNGFENSIGFMHQKIKIEKQIVYVEKSSIGLNLGLSKTDAGANLGYKNTIRVFVPENTVIDIDRQPHLVDVDIKKTSLK